MKKSELKALLDALEGDPEILVNDMEPLQPEDVEYVGKTGEGFLHIGDW